MNGDFVKNWGKYTCSQCGTCSGICPTKAINMIRDTDGNFSPSIDESRCNNCNICKTICPGLSLDYTHLNKLIFNKYPKNIFLGNYENCYVGYSTDDSILKRSSSGGIVSSILIYALERNIINGAIVTKFNDADPLKPEIIIARTKEEILSAAQSKYMPVPLNIAIREIINEEGKFAVVGLPCHINGIRNAERVDERIRERINLHIGLFCGHCDNIHATTMHLRRRRVSSDMIERLEYRGDNWPGKVSARLKDGTINSVRFLDSDFKHIHACGFFMPPYCTMCCDATSELSDISVGDAWLTEYKESNQGRSIVIARNKNSNELVRDMENNGAIRLSECTPKQVVKSQLAQIFFKKKNIAARKSILRLIGKNIPNDLTNILRPTVLDYFGATILYSSTYLVSKAASKKILDRLPGVCYKAYSRFFKIATSMPPIGFYLKPKRKDTIKKNIPIAVLGSYHGHNAGDNAILASIVNEFKRLNPNIQLNVLSGRPWLLEGKFDINIISSRPRNLSINMLGLPAFWSIYHSDMVILTQAIFFDNKLFNPAYNYLIALYLLVPFAKLLNKPIICYNVGIGPLNTKLGKTMARSILNRVDRIILRQSDSQELLKALQVVKPQVIIGADPALKNVPASKDHSINLIKEVGIGCENLIGVNITGYIDKFIKNKNEQINEDKFIEIMSEFCDKVTENLGVKIVFIVTTSSYDERITRKLRDKMHDKQASAIMSNKEYSHQEIMGVLGLLELFVGMRLHSIVLAVAMYTPVVGLVYAPKVRDFMRRIGQEDKIIEFEDFDANILYQTVNKTWDKRYEIRNELKVNISKLRDLVEESTESTLEYIHK